MGHLLRQSSIERKLFFKLKGLRIYPGTLSEKLMIDNDSMNIVKDTKLQTKRKYLQYITNKDCHPVQNSRKELP